MEPEETPERETYISGEMMATIRDDPEKYRQMMPPMKPPTANTEAKSPAVAAAAPRAPSVAGYSIPQAAPNVPPPTQSTGTRSIIVGIGVVTFLILLFVILWILKVI
jgi:hypothetical protein